MRLGILAGLLLASFIARAEVWAHGNEHHSESVEMNEHMAQMMELREQVPEEYRVMNRTPVIPDDSSLGHGEDLYRRFCLACHGSEGRGDGPAAKALNPKPANFLDLKHSAIYGPGEKYWIIGNGSGKTGMPGFGKELSPKDRWDLVNHIYLLQEGEPEVEKHEHHH